MISPCHCEALAGSDLEALDYCSTRATSQGIVARHPGHCTAMWLARSPALSASPFRQRHHGRRKRKDPRCSVGACWPLIACVRRQLAGSSNRASDPPELVRHSWPRRTRDRPRLGEIGRRLDRRDRLARTARTPSFVSARCASLQRPCRLAATSVGPCSRRGAAVSSRPRRDRWVLLRSGSRLLLLIEAAVRMPFVARTILSGLNSCSGCENVRSPYQRVRRSR